VEIYVASNKTRTLFVLSPRQKKKQNDIQWDKTTSKKPVVLLLPDEQSWFSSATVVNWGTPSVKFMLLRHARLHYYTKRAPWVRAPRQNIHPPFLPPRRNKSVVRW